MYAREASSATIPRLCTASGSASERWVLASPVISKTHARHAKDTDHDPLSRRLPPQELDRKRSSSTWSLELIHRLVKLLPTTFKKCAIRPDPTPSRVSALSSPSNDAFSDRATRLRTPASHFFLSESQDEFLQGLSLRGRRRRRPKYSRRVQVLLRARHGRRPTRVTHGEFRFSSQACAKFQKRPIFSSP